MKREFFSPELKKDNFAEKKEKVADFLRREARGEDVGSGLEENEGELDDNVRGLVEKMNQLSFLYTSAACGGHVATREFIKARHPDVEEEFLRLPPADKARYTSGDLHFYTNRDKQSQKFISRLKKIVDRFKGATLYDPSIQTEPERRELPYMLHFGESRFGGRRSIPIQEARELELKVERLKKEMEKLVEDFLQIKK